MADYRQTYSAMTDDQLLNLAQETAVLVPEAMSALGAELTNRKLGTPDVARYAEDLHNAEMAAAQKSPLAQTFNGFGTKIYGKRNPRADGSFLTTKWVVLFWIPFIPLRSLRVKYIGPGDTTILPGWARKYIILAETRPDIRQALNIYSFMFSFAIGLWILESIHAGSFENWSALTFGPAPWLVRRALGVTGKDTDDGIG
jgi:hypothetical protein